MATVKPLHPAIEAADRAPLAEPLPPEIEEIVAKHQDEILSGRVQVVPHAEVERTLASMRPVAG